MELKSLLAKSKKVEVEFPGMPGFKVKLGFVSKDELRKITNKAKTYDFDKVTRQPVESVDDELFTKLYIEKAVLGWKGLTGQYLSELVLIENMKDLPDDFELDYSTDNALELINNSKTFDGWVSSVISDITVFNRGS